MFKKSQYHLLFQYRISLHKKTLHDIINNSIRHIKKQVNKHKFIFY